MHGEGDYCIILRSLSRAQPGLIKTQEARITGARVLTGRREGVGYLARRARSLVDPSSREGKREEEGRAKNERPEK